jgi:uncharacterized protein YkwD
MGILGDYRNFDNRSLMGWRSKGNLRVAFVFCAVAERAARAARTSIAAVASASSVVAGTSVVLVASVIWPSGQALAREQAPQTETAQEAAPLAAPDQAMLDAVNAARSEARTCGTQTMPATRPLRWHADAAKVALAHSQDQAKHAKLTHTGSDGSTPSQRANRAGVAWQTIGENVYRASWEASAEEAVRAWLKSPGHCRNLMQSFFTHLGAGYAEGAQQGEPQGRKHRYWTQVFVQVPAEKAAPKR